MRKDKLNDLKKWQKKKKERKKRIYDLEFLTKGLKTKDKI